jgi:hypothetical protein
MKLKCKTPFPKTEVAGLGTFSTGDVIGDGTKYPISDSLGNQLKLGGEWEDLDKEPAALSTPHKRKFKQGENYGN